MKIKYFFLLITASFLISCGSKDSGENKPDSILDQETFANILLDIELLDATIKQKLLNRSHPKKNAAIYYKQVMDKHNITHEQYQVSFDWWQQHPEGLKEIDELVEEKLKLMKTDLKGVEEEKEPVEKESKD